MTLAADWQVWDSAKEGTEGTIHIDYDGDYGSERVLIVSGRATVTPCDGSPSFTVSPGDAVYFMAGFRCTWHIHEAPLVQRYGFFGLRSHVGSTISLEYHRWNMAVLIRCWNVKR